MGVFEVYDMDTVTRDDPMGSIELEVADLEKLRGGHWIPLQGCTSGEIFISATLPFSESESTQEADQLSTETRTVASPLMEEAASKDEKKGGVRSVKAVLTEDKQPDEDFEEAMLRRQQKLEEKLTATNPCMAFLIEHVKAGRMSSQGGAWIVANAIRNIKTPTVELMNELIAVFKLIHGQSQAHLTAIA